MRMNGEINGAYSDWINGRKFNADRYKKRLERAYKIGKPYISIIPDLVAKGTESLDFSMGWIDILPNDWNCLIPSNVHPLDKITHP